MSFFEFVWSMVGCCLTTLGTLGKFEKVDRRWLRVAGIGEFRFSPIAHILPCDPMPRQGCWDDIASQLNFGFHTTPMVGLRCPLNPGRIRGG